VDGVFTILATDTYFTLVLLRAYWVAINNVVKCIRNNINYRY